LKGDSVGVGDHGWFCDVNGRRGKELFVSNSEVHTINTSLNKNLQYPSCNLFSKGNTLF
jgi:hypothetical protein